LDSLDRPICLTNREELTDLVSMKVKILQTIKARRKAKASILRLPLPDLL
jgi:hypothetical protein